MNKYIGYEIPEHGLKILDIRIYQKTSLLFVIGDSEGSATAVARASFYVNNSTPKAWLSIRRLSDPKLVFRQNLHCPASFRFEEILAAGKLEECDPKTWKWSSSNAYVEIPTMDYSKEIKAEKDVKPEDSMNPSTGVPKPDSSGTRQ